MRKRKGKEEKMETVNREVLDMHAGREEKRKGKGGRPGGLLFVSPIGCGAFVCVCVLKSIKLHG